LISPVIAPSPLEVEAVATTENVAFFPRGIAILFLNHVLKIIDELKIKIKILPNTCDLSTTPYLCQHRLDSAAL